MRLPLVDVVSVLVWRVLSLSGCVTCCFVMLTRECSMRITFHLVVICVKREKICWCWFAGWHLWKINPITGLDRPFGLQEVDAPRNSKKKRLIKVVRLSGLGTCRVYPSGNILGTHFCYRLSRTQTDRIMPTKNFSDPISNRTRDLPACNAVPQKTAPPRAQGFMKTTVITRVLFHVFIYCVRGNINFFLSKPQTKIEVEGKPEFALLVRCGNRFIVVSVL
jgi:hypothetical protein